ncbi:hypothetical protein NDU88_007080 [Pleurodeles waltl]|uniref:Uncharacterized protein n=1 Tax=Pleurodeles waltl TaxID=8319 RepID=A0AAV7RQT2_PLEWA|nr:hypothetical protein NDU88_007080 [Pleurodeles waltl]
MARWRRRSPGRRRGVIAGPREGCRTGAWSGGDSPGLSGCSLDEAGAGVRRASGAGLKEALREGGALAPIGAAGGSWGLRWIPVDERKAHLRRRPGTGLRRDPDLAVGDLENPKRHQRQRRVRDPKNGPYKYAEAGGDRQLEEARPGRLPDTQMRERTPRTRRLAAV